MRIIRFLDESGKIVTAADHGDGSAEALGGAFPDFTRTGETVQVGRLLAPLVPTDLLCIGLNYRAHAAETGSTPPANPMLFIKGGNALAGSGDAISLPGNSSKVDYEAELVVVIGRDARHVPPERAMDHVFGYSVANDVSARDWQKDPSLNGGQFARGKSFDGFCPFGPAIVTADEVPDPDALDISLRLNGQIMQQSNTRDMIFDVRSIIASLSETMTVRAGSIILTGTPEGVGVARKPPVFLKDGDRVVVEIERVGTLLNTFVADH